MINRSLDVRQRVLSLSGAKPGKGTLQRDFVQSMFSTCKWAQESMNGITWMTDAEG
jgi:hypothetical protein